MRSRRAFAIWLGGMLLCSWWALPLSAAPWDSLLTLNRVEADPNKSYVLTEENGPWMIMACSFSGEHAAQQAKELVLEFRKRYKLPAYVYRKRFEFDEGSPAGYSVDQHGNPVRLHYQRGEEVEEVAVLVGDFPAIDDPQAQAALHRIKYYRPACLELNGAHPTALNLAAWRLFWKHVDREKQKRGPMGHAMLTTNPLLPKEQFAPSGLDDVVLKANEGVEHSLLDCPGKYTVQVATFTGEIAARQGEIAQLANKPLDPSKSKLVEAAEKAHRLTEGLRLKGYEAYEFHDRYASIVTVGSFDWVTRKLPDGAAEFNPQIRAVIERFQGKQTNLGGMTGGLAQQMFLDLPFDLQPRVVHVPQRPLTARAERPVRNGY